jgi:hypothetical protein
MVALSPSWGLKGEKVRCDPDPHAVAKKGWWAAMGLDRGGLPEQRAEFAAGVGFEKMLGILGTVTSRARALYRRICDVALKSPRGSAVTIMTAFWGFRR